MYILTLYNAIIHDDDDDKTINNSNYYVKKKKTGKFSTLTAKLEKNWIGQPLI